MLTEEEIDSLARQILAFAIEEVSSWDDGYFHAIEETDDGEPVPVYSATSVEGLGSFVMEFMPLATIKTIIRSSERTFETFIVVLSNSTTGEKEPRRVAELASPKTRRQAIDFTSRWASLNLIAFMRQRLSDCIEEAVHDCGVISESLLAVALAEAISKEMPVTADAREEIEKAVTRTANKKRRQLQEHIEGLPHLITKTRLGAPPKSSAQRQQDRAAYTARIEAAYRKLRIETGQRPTKRSVAGELGEGGLSASGGDSRLNAFNVKLGRRGINYNELLERIESELQQ
ncbi:MAG: hypothetical protein AABN95_00995 [Acidobacteriota bacterium]